MLDGEMNGRPVWLEQKEQEDGTEGEVRDRQELDVREQTDMQLSGK